MLIQYQGSRGMVSMTCSGRKILYFGPENNFTNDVVDEGLASEILSSRLHNFRVILPKAVLKKEPEVINKEKVIKPEVKKVKKGKKNG